MIDAAGCRLYRKSRLVGQAQRLELGLPLGFD
jgi:hypothetical protein